jgi:hypothetical protein
MWKVILLVVVLLIVGAAALAFWSYRQANDETERALAAIAGRAKPPIGTFDLAMGPGCRRSRSDTSPMQLRLALLYGQPFSSKCRARFSLVIGQNIRLTP